jgi:[acyl-carrier-protein] S-malonyltransferase
MKIAFVFPGQGSQSVGMLDSFQGDAAVNSVIARAKSALGDDIGALIVNGPAEDLNLTVNTHPAMLVAASRSTAPGGLPAVRSADRGRTQPWRIHGAHCVRIA